MKTKIQTISSEEYETSIKRLDTIKKMEETYQENYKDVTSDLNIPRNFHQNLEIELIYLQRKNYEIDTQIELEVQKFLMNFEPNKTLCRLLEQKLYILIELIDNNLLTDENNRPDLEILSLINNYPQIEITLDTIKNLIKQKHKNLHAAQYINELLEEKTKLSIQTARYEKVHHISPKKRTLSKKNNIYKPN